MCICSDARFIGHFYVIIWFASIKFLIKDNKRDEGILMDFPKWSLVHGYSSNKK